MNALAELSNNAIFHYAIIFARIGSIMLFIPGFGESYVSSRSRLTIALAFGLVLFPLISPYLPPMPADIIILTLILGGEVVIGIFMGLLIRIIQSTLHIAGMKIAFMCGLSTATLFDANQSTQGSIVGGFLSVVGITLFFTAGLHHIVFKAIAESFMLIRTAEMPPLNDFVETMSRTVSDSFLIAFKVAVPIMIVGTLLYLGAGLMGRLMPTMQVFFILMPIQIYIGLLFIGISLSTTMLIYINFFEDKLLTLF